MNVVTAGAMSIRPTVIVPCAAAPVVVKSCWDGGAVRPSSNSPAFRASSSGTQTSTPSGTSTIRPAGLLPLTSSTGPWSRPEGWERAARCHATSALTSAIGPVYWTVWAGLAEKVAASVAVLVRWNGVQVAP
ncbi:hypothetical protein SCALM49S_05948 [Streptomyces californicus]